jgi:hypothetical protein
MHGQQIRQKGFRESREDDARAQARHTSERWLGQEGDEPQTGDRDRTLRSTSRRRQSPGGAEEVVVEEEPFIEKGCFIEKGHFIEEGHFIEKGHFIEEGHFIKEGRSIEEGRSIKEGHFIEEARLDEVAQIHFNEAIRFEKEIAAKTWLQPVEADEAGGPACYSPALQSTSHVRCMFTRRLADAERNTKGASAGERPRSAGILPAGPPAFSRHGPVRVQNSIRVPNDTA